jgi:hypothetical protein
VSFSFDEFFSQLLNLAAARHAASNAKLLEVIAFLQTLGLQTYKVKPQLEVFRKLTQFLDFIFPRF